MANIFSNSLSNLDNLVFEGRNKEYGAFQLRKKYLNYLTKAIAISCFAFISIILFIFYLGLNGNEDISIYKSVDYKTTDFSMQKVSIPKLNIEKIPEEKIDVPKENLPPKPEEKVEEQTIPEHKTGETTSTTLGVNESTLGKDVNNVKSFSNDTLGTELYTDEIFMKVETSAEFPGGKDSFEKFVSEKIVFPSYALNNKIKGIIYVHMVVNRDGSISDLKLYKGIEQSCNEEVLRIMKLSPNWIPARKEGKPVRQRLIVPVKFEVP